MNAIPSSLPRTSQGAHPLWIIPYIPSAWLSVGSNTSRKRLQNRPTISRASFHPDSSLLHPYKSAGPVLNERCDVRLSPSKSDCAVKEKERDLVRTVLLWIGSHPLTLISGGNYILIQTHPFKEAPLRAAFRCLPFA